MSDKLPPPAKLGFSLVELAIVLVVLGLLVGGVLSGKSLIRAAQLRLLTEQHQQFYTATHAFKDKYFALPGDMTNATQFWGVRAVGAACMGSASTDARTCNGDGNGQIDFMTSESFEMSRYWQHLANAGLLAGQYNGTSTLPAAKTGGDTKWAVMWQGTLNSGLTAFYGEYAHFISLSSITTSYLLPEETWNIDNKLDDGKPATGKIVGNTIAACTNAASTTDYAAEYLFSSSTRNCRPIFRLQF
jgi:prepilin-type N-terminal cleavage/methylation domain-containing protein